MKIQDVLFVQTDHCDRNATLSIKRQNDVNYEYITGKTHQLSGVP